MRARVGESDGVLVLGSGALRLQMVMWHLDTPAGKAHILYVLGVHYVLLSVSLKTRYSDLELLKTVYGARSLRSPRWR